MSFLPSKIGATALWASSAIRYYSNSSVFEITQRVHDLISANKSHDSFGNLNIDLRYVEEFTSDNYAQALKQELPNIIALAKSEDHHLITIKLSSGQTALYKYVQEAGFKFHQASYDSAMVVTCLKHPLEECPYPKHKTLSVGVTAVVFNRELTKFLAVKETVGPYREWKAPTGGVDYENGDDPLQAAVREVLEETNIVVTAKSALLIGTGWTPLYRGPNPDINFTYAFTLDEELHTPTPQASEIADVTWLKVSDFLENPTLAGTSSVLERVITASHEALLRKGGMKPEECVWGSGKKVTFYT